MDRYKVGWDDYDKVIWYNNILHYLQEISLLDLFVGIYID